MLTQQDLQDHLLYDQLSGVFTRKKTSGGIKAGSLAGCLNQDGYAVIRIKNTLHYAHRLAWFYVYGVLPDLQIDHIDGNKSNNCIENLRLATNQENSQNERKARNKSRVNLLGVCRKGKKYKAQIKVKGKTINIGYFTNEQDAHEAYVRAKRQLHPYGML